MKKVLSLTLMFILILGLFPAMPLQSQASEIDTIVLQYDDHMDMTGKTVRIIEAGTSSQGAVITLRQNTLVATGIGSATVSIDGTVHSITVGKAKLNLIMIMGQSNAGNHFANSTSDVTCPAGTAYWWGNGLGVSATVPVSFTQPFKGFQTPLLAELYAQSVAAGNPVKNVMIWHEGITCRSGQSIQKWASSETDTSGTDGSVTMLNNCRAYYEKYSDRYEIVSSGVYWLQGETDQSMDPTLYTQLFTAMWNRLKSEGMEYVAFLRVRRNAYPSVSNRDDLFYSAALSAQIKMINDTPEFYMASTITENWYGDEDVEHTMDISRYITMMETYGKAPSYSDEYGNTATYADGKLTTTMATLYGSNNICHYGKFGYGIIGADAAYNMYRAFHSDHAAIVVADTSGHADQTHVLSDEESVTIDITNKAAHLSFRGDCGNTSGTLKFMVRSGITDITERPGVVITSGENYYSVDTSLLRGYPNVSIFLTYTTTDGAVHTAVCNLENHPEYIWDFNEDLDARCADGKIVNSFLSESLAGSYTIENGYLNASGLQLALDSSIVLHSGTNWSIEWKYGALGGGTAGFLLCKTPGNTVGNQALWHTLKGNLCIANYLDTSGYRNYTCDDIIIRDYDRLKLSNDYDPATGKNTISLWINDQLVIPDFQLKGSINGYHDDRDMSDYPLSADFVFSYLGNSGLTNWLVNCQLDYLKVSFGSVPNIPQEQNYYLVGYLNGSNYGCEEDYENMGQYVFENGLLTTTFTTASYVFVKTENNAQWFMTDGWQGDTVTSVSLYDSGILFAPNKLHVPGGVEVTFLLTRNSDGSLTLSYTKNSTITVPTVNLRYPSVSFEDVITMNIYYTADHLQDVVQMGLITYSYNAASYGVETAEHVIPGYTWSEEDGMYYSSTTGIAPKDIGDTIYFAVYSKLTNGQYHYTSLIPYSPRTYAYNQLRTGSAEMKSLVVAMLGYGAAAQTYFNYKTDALVNATMTDEQKAMAEAYRADMIAPVTQVTGAKVANFVNDKTYSQRYPTISFEGAFCINYYFQPSLAVVGDVTMYIWSLEDCEAADVLTEENATKAVKMELTESGEYMAVVDGIAAKDLDKAAYVSFVYNDGTTEHCGGVIAYTIGMYCKSQASGTGNLAELSKACAVYGYYAKQLFG